VFDTSGSYHTALIISGVVLVISAATLLLVGRYRDFETTAEG